jgi:hypothetical protein
MFAAFKRDFNKTYASPDEETIRYHTFLKNLRLADERNYQERSEGGDGSHGVTKYMDIHPDDFKLQFRTSFIKSESSEAIPAVITQQPLEHVGLVDWTGKYTTPVKDQGSCGSCWAVSATEQIESDTMRTLGETYVLAPQQIVSCDGGDGCQGGFPEQAYRYVKHTGGIVEEASYKYTSGTTGESGECKVDIAEAVVTVRDYYSITGEGAMATYVQSNGPLNICIDANNWQTYTGGIMATCGKQLDHCVQVVGVKADIGGYWKVRNSWGTDWGESGYIRLLYGHDVCGITQEPSYTTVSLVSRR